MNESEIIIDKKFKELPLAIQIALSTFDWKDEVKKIAEETKLTPEQEALLQTEILLLLYSLEPKDNFYDNLVGEVGLDEDSAENIFELVEERIVVKIAEKIEGTSPENESSTIASSESIPATDPIPAKVGDSTLPKLASLPDYSSDYEPGKDPYKEPIN